MKKKLRALAFDFLETGRCINESSHMAKWQNENVRVEYMFQRILGRSVSIEDCKSKK